MLARQYRTSTRLKAPVSSAGEAKEPFIAFGSNICISAYICDIGKAPGKVPPHLKTHAVDSFMESEYM